jgi:hypothetical protein
MSELICRRGIGIPERGSKMKEAPYMFRETKRKILDVVPTMIVTLLF